MAEKGRLSVTALPAAVIVKMVAEQGWEYTADNKFIQKS